MNKKKLVAGHDEKVKELFNLYSDKILNTFVSEAGIIEKKMREMLGEAVEFKTEDRAMVYKENIHVLSALGVAYEMELIARNKETKRFISIKIIKNLELMQKQNLLRMLNLDCVNTNESIIKEEKKSFLDRIRQARLSELLSALENGDFNAVIITFKLYFPLFNNELEKMKILNAAFLSMQKNNISSEIYKFIKIYYDSGEATQERFSPKIQLGSSGECSIDFWVLMNIHEALFNLGQETKGSFNNWIDNILPTVKSTADKIEQDDRLNDF